MRSLVEELCSSRCAGRAPGTTGGRAARGVVTEALRGAGLDPHEQEVPSCRGANVLATIPGDVDRWVMVAAHYDHLGTVRGRMYPGADDNAAAVAILVEVAARLAAAGPRGRGVLIAAFDAEEPPHFLTESMGSEHYARHPVVPLERTDMFVCMDLVGHALGQPGMPAAVRQSLFLLGAERSQGTSAMVDEIAAAEPGLIIRRADAEIIPTLSDYAAFWRRRVPFAFLTGGRSSVYHTPEDTPDLLDLDKMAATARWLEQFVRASCARDEPIEFREIRDDVATLHTVSAMCDALAPAIPLAEGGGRLARSLLAACDRDGRVPDARFGEVAALIELLEDGLS
jgi:hypothetical protein